jgi:hypothetical protein
MMGLEPTASGATIQRSNLLSYIRHVSKVLIKGTIALLVAKFQCFIGALLELIVVFFGNRLINGAGVYQIVILFQLGRATPFAK